MYHVLIFFSLLQQLYLLYVYILLVVIVVLTAAYALFLSIERERRRVSYYKVSLCLNVNRK